jgi:hypothetical protein
MDILLIVATIALFIVAFMIISKRGLKDPTGRQESTLAQHRRELETTRGKEEAAKKHEEEKSKQQEDDDDAADRRKRAADRRKNVAEANAKSEIEKRFNNLKSNLPFYVSNRPPSSELADHDKNAWEEVRNLVEAAANKQATLYFIKVKSLLDDKEYYKIGITTAGVKARFKKSTQVELLETVCSFDTELWKAAYLEYHFLREFRLYDGLASSLGELRPEVGFSGYTEVVRSNSVSKISEFFGELGVYNKLK